MAAIWAGASFPGSTATSLTSEYLAACALALLVIAAIQPWSAAGAVKPMVTVFPGDALVPPFTFVWPFASLFFVSLDVQPVSSALAPRADPPSSSRRRDVDIRVLLPGCATPSGPGAGSQVWGVWSGHGRSAARQPGKARGYPEPSDLELLDEHGADDDRAVDDALGFRRQVVDGEQVGDLAEDEDPEQQAHDRAAAAAERGATDDRGGDRVQLVQVPVGVRPGRGLCDHDDRGDAAAQSGQRVQREG